ncbi:hypothetical protein FB45DRAFT_361173 [Roridomyces roridus]|uniref:Uncharacterized protein n=1 Tax=Roridomyces roridus TaxID=1738132 RepID=A0AAD7C8G7_9AGAR|nr:hypothetical protein FB45DRAFT_361173 [Roridomyces roridus]
MSSFSKRSDPWMEEPWLDYVVFPGGAEISSTDVPDSNTPWSCGRMVWSPHPNAEPTAVAVKALLARRAAWSNVDLITSATKTFEFDSFACSQELVHGVYAQQFFHYFTAIRIPSAADPSASFYLWQRADVGLGTLDLVQFAMDPTQDLVVFLYNGQDEISRLVCRRLSSLQPHPFAAVALLAFPNPWTLCHFAMEIADDIIAIFPQTCRLRLVLYDWRRGNIIHDVHFEPHIASFHFLTPRVFVLASRQDSGSIEIWSLGDDEPIQPVHVATLQLPSIVGGGAAMLRHVDIYSNPFLAYPTAGKPWSKSNERRLCAFCLRYRVGEDNNDWLYDLFVHSRYLLTYAARPGNQLETVAWDSWGPQHSRMLVREIWQMFRDMFRCVLSWFLSSHLVD